MHKMIYKALQQFVQEPAHKTQMFKQAQKTVGLCFACRVHQLTLAILCTTALATQTHAFDFSFAIIGDTPYNSTEERILNDVLADIGKSNVQFIVHNGDIKSGSELCSDTLLTKRLDQLKQSIKPLIYTPGDNEWTDCHRPNNGSYDPMERLTFLRKQAFTQNQSLGKTTIPLTQQIGASEATTYPENMRWEHQGVVFVTVNIPGSNNNVQLTPSTSAALNSDFEQRMQANAVWLESAFQYAQKNEAQGVVIAMQGNLFEGSERNPTGSDGYEGARKTIASLAEKLKKPVLLTHGDTHYHRVDHPLKNPDRKPVLNVTRVENFGSPFASNWVEVKVQPNQTPLFMVVQHRIYSQGDTK
jgi:hypothetical protein